MGGVAQFPFDSTPPKSPLHLLIAPLCHPSSSLALNLPSHHHHRALSSPHTQPLALTTPHNFAPSPPASSQLCPTTITRLLSLGPKATWASYLGRSSIYDAPCLPPAGARMSPIGDKIGNPISVLCLQHFGQDAADLLDGQLFAADVLPFVVLGCRGLDADVGKLGWEEDRSLQPGQCGVAGRG